MILSCAIIDDEPLAAKLLQTYVERTPFLELAGSYASAVEAMGGLREHPVDVLFLDIQMPELNGLEFARLVDSDTRIVFTTAFGQYAIDGYKVDALDYLLKPVNYADFLTAAQRALEWFERMVAATREKNGSDTVKGSFFVKSDYKLVRIHLDDIRYVEGLKDYVKIYLASAARPVLSLMSMRTIEQHLPAETFRRVHRSYIVNLDRVEMLERGQIVFDNKYVPVSDSYKEQMQEYIDRRLLRGRGNDRGGVDVADGR